jgi:hypothetical protein
LEKPNHILAFLESLVIAKEYGFGLLDHAAAFEPHEVLLVLPDEQTSGVIWNHRGQARDYRVLLGTNGAGHIDLDGKITILLLKDSRSVDFAFAWPQIMIGSRYDEGKFALVFGDLAISFRVGHLAPTLDLSPWSVLGGKRWHAKNKA